MTSSILQIRRPTAKQVNRDKVRTLRRARRAGWTLVEISKADGRFWADVVKLAQASIAGKCVPWYNSPTGTQHPILGIIAFELESDAVWFQLKFG